MFSVREHAGQAADRRAQIAITSPLELDGPCNSHSVRKPDEVAWLHGSWDTLPEQGRLENRGPVACSSSFWNVYALD